MHLVTKMSEAAANASERFVPRPFRSMMDRTLVEVVCVGRGGIAPLANELMVDVPAIDAWKTIGVPAEFRGRLTAMAMLPTRPVWRTAA